MKSPHAKHPVQSVTTAPEPLADDQARRFKVYTIQMSIRALCFLGCVLIDHWSRWVLAVFAVFLPYVAVLLVNAGRDHRTSDVMSVDRRALPPGAARGDGTEPPDERPRPPREGEQ
ncbi:DUF3099 domain-containing protein [Paraoerskovia sediminicola]|uniref:DUF3099 domain-containing protein n=1 Tax=Paraoerskovia sediminicola TaxID=1138587 RepID=UPI0025736C29|nr:DUF3099 domain-containing protein [Paraoerskovia sediminicola]